VVLTWPTVPADEPVHVTLAGRTAREWTPVPTYAAWRRTAASRISVDVWNPDIRRFEPLETDRTVDASDRLYLGRVPAEYLRTGRLCLRVRTHTSLSPATDALWLGGVFVHPHPERHYLNVNLLPPRSVSILCQSNVAAATTLLSKLQRTPSGVPVCTSLLSLGQALRAASAHARVPADRCSVRTDVFRLDVEAEVVRGSGTNTTVLAHTRREWEIDRSGIRLAPGTVARSQLPATMY
jgi:hypothetical protein